MLARREVGAEGLQEGGAGDGLGALGVAVEGDAQLGDAEAGAGRRRVAAEQAGLEGEDGGAVVEALDGLALTTGEVAVVDAAVAVVVDAVLALADAEEAVAGDELALAAGGDRDLLLAGVRARVVAAGEGGDRDVVGACADLGAGDGAVALVELVREAGVLAGVDDVVGALLGGGDADAADAELAALARGEQRLIGLGGVATDLPAEHEARVLGAGRGERERGDGGEGEAGHPCVSSRRSRAWQDRRRGAARRRRRGSPARRRGRRR